jgi:imidazolonepropionase-like amidohydrolase
MTLSPRTLTLLMLLSPMASLAQTRAPSPPLVLISANVIDGVSLQSIRGATVAIREGRIASIEPAGTEPLRDAAVVDLQGKRLLPGLIDAHVHPADLAAARVALAAGVTTMRTGS